MYSIESLDDRNDVILSLSYDLMMISWMQNKEPIMGNVFSCKLTKLFLSWIYFLQKL